MGPYCPRGANLVHGLEKMLLYIKTQMYLQIHKLSSGISVILNFHEGQLRKKMSEMAPQGVIMK